MTINPVCYSTKNPMREKRSYRSKAAARKFITQHAGQAAGRARYPYLCSTCGRWHISGTPTRKGQAAPPPSTS